jgi:hypothetical protein
MQLFRTRVNFDPLILKRSFTLTGSVGLMMNADIPECLALQVTTIQTKPKARSIEP